MSKKIGYARGASDAVRLTEIVGMHPGASTRQIAAKIWPVFPEDLLDAFAPDVESDLQSLQRFGIVEHADGWHPSQHRDPFKHIVQTSTDDASLVSTLWSVSLIYFGTGERRLAAVMERICRRSLEGDEASARRLFLPFGALLSRIRMAQGSQGYSHTA